LLCVFCVTGGAAWGKAPEVKIVTPPDTITVSVGQAVPFEASIATDDTARTAPKVQWLWDFGDKATSDKNPTTYAFGEAGIYKVTVTATTDDGTATASVEVIVTSGEGGGVKQVVECLYIREMVPPKTTVANDEACDGIEVVFETTNMVMNTPTLEKKVPGGTWESKGTGTEEQTGIPGTRRWYWSWPTWGEKNWGIEFRVQYRKPPMPGTLVTVGPETFTVTNTVVNGTQELLLWNGTDAVIAPWNIVHSPHRTPKFTVTVSIMPVGSDTAVKTYSLANRDAGGGSLSWQGETTAGGTAPPGVYTYTVGARHAQAPIWCSDGDKADSVLELAQATVHDLTVPTLSLHTQASLRANQAAGYAWVELFHDDTPKQLSGAELGPLAGDPTVWWPIEFTDDIDHDDVGRYLFVATGVQGAAAAQSNRSAAPKWLKPVIGEFEEWPATYSLAGHGCNNTPEAPLEAQATTAHGALGGYVSPQGYHYASELGGNDTATLYGKLPTSSVVFIAAHGAPNRQVMENGCDPLRDEIRGGTASADPPGNDPASDIYYIEELADGMDHCRFVFFAGCDTADRNEAGESLVENAVAMGADLAAGFRAYEYAGLPAVVMFYDLFWQHALVGGQSVRVAARKSIAEARKAYGSDALGGVETFYLYPTNGDENLWDVEWGD